MAVADGAAVVFSIEKLSDDSILQETRSCEDEEFLLFLLKRERQSHVRIENYFECTKPLYIVSDFLIHFRMSRTTVSCLERLLTTCLGLPHGHGIEHCWAKWSISDPSPIGTRWINDPVIRWSVFRSRRSVIRWTLVQSGFARKERHRSEIQIQILPKERTLTHASAANKQADS